MADPKPTHTYVGNPGYESVIGGQLVVLDPGDPVTLSPDEADGFGDDFMAVDDPLAALTAKQLVAYASDHGVDLDGATKKADVLAAIRAAESASTDDQPPAGDETTTEES